MQILNHQRSVQEGTFTTRCTGLGETESEHKRQNREKFIRSIVINAQKAARRYVQHVLNTAESSMVRPQDIEITLQGTISTMHLYGVKSELCEYAAKYAMRLLRERHVR